MKLKSNEVAEGIINRMKKIEIMVKREGKGNCGDWRQYFHSSRLPWLGGIEILSIYSLLQVKYSSN